MTQRNNCLLCNFPGRQKIVKVINEYNFKRCKNCGLIYLEPQIDDSALKDIYSEKYFHSQHPEGYGDFVARKDDVINYRLKAIMDLINNIKPNKGKLLEIGCALGYFLELAQDSGWEAKGVELSLWASQYAREKTKVHVFTGKLEDVKFPDLYFDAIVMIELLEHTPNPQVFLKEVHRVLKPDGIILITTPNSKSIHGKIWKKTFQETFFIPEHLFLFSISTINHMLELINFKIIHLQTKTYLRRYYDYKVPPGILRQIRKLGRKLMLKLINRLNLGEMLLVIAKKSS